MKTYVIRRQGNWKDADELAITAELSARVGREEMPDRVRWIRTYVVREPDGRLGTVCIYQASDPAALFEHARRVGMSCEEIVPVEDTVVIQGDPAAREMALA